MEKIDWVSLLAWLAVFFVGVIFWVLVIKLGILIQVLISLGLGFLIIYKIERSKK